MDALRNLSARPELVVDDHGERITDPSGAVVGIPAPLGRERVVFALPLQKTLPSPLRLAALTSDHGVLLADPGGNLIGREGVWIARLLYAQKTEDTRRL